MYLSNRRFISLEWPKRYVLLNGEPRLERYEADRCSFIVKIWIEERGEGAQNALWRGYITHVPSNRRQYFQTLDTITTFIASYLEQMGVTIDTRS